jgi:hypothetical protein
MDKAVERMLAAVTKSDRDAAIDQIGSAAIDKWERPADRTLTDAERTIALVWNAYLLAINGGTTEALACMDGSQLLEALHLVGWHTAAVAVSRLQPLIREAEASFTGLTRVERDKRWFALKDGPWRDDDGVFYVNEGEAEATLFDYIRVRQSEIALEEYVT